MTETETIIETEIETTTCDRCDGCGTPLRRNDAYGDEDNDGYYCHERHS